MLKDPKYGHRYFLGSTIKTIAAEHLGNFVSASTYSSYL